MNQIQIVEVGPRDGLQNEKTPIPTDIKLQFIQNLLDAGLHEIEVTSFVHPKWVPQLADAKELIAQLPASPNYKFSALVPNLKGLEAAQETHINRIALFTAASDAFTQKNINMSVSQSLEIFAEVAKQFRTNEPNGYIRGYVSTIIECPIAGPVEAKSVIQVVEKLLEIGVDEISLGETIGVAVPSQVKALAAELRPILGPSKTAWHFHDTRGTAIANVNAMLEMDYRRFDSSAAGLGGCPYAPGAGGNLATEDLIYLCEKSGLKTGVDLQKLSLASLPILEHLQRNPSAKVQLAQLASCPSAH